MASAFLGFGGPPKPAGAGDAWGQGIGNLVGAWLQGQPTLADQEAQRQQRDLFDARTGLVREQTRAAQAESAMRALGLEAERRKQGAMQDFIQRNIAAERQTAPAFVGPADPGLSRPSPWEGLLAGIKPEDQAQVNLISEAMRDVPDDNRLRVLSAAGYKPVSNNQSVSSAELQAAQALEQEKFRADNAAKLQAANIQAGATLGAARIRGPSSAGGGDRFQIIEGTDANGAPIKLRVNPQTGQAEPLMMGGQPVAGKRKDLTAPIQKSLGEYGDQYTSLNALKAGFKDEFAGQPILGKVSNWAGRTFGDEGQAQFWQRSDALDMAVRNQMFGAALTAHEQRLWEAASINPGMNPDQIRENINRRASILEGAARRRISAYEKGGFDRSQMEILSGFTPVPAGTPAPAASPAAADPLGMR